MSEPNPTSDVPHPAAEVLNCLQRAWSQLQEIDPRVPPAVLLLLTADARGKHLGHFARSTWRPSPTDVPPLPPPKRGCPRLDGPIAQRIREHLGLTLQQLGEQAGYTRGYLSNIEREVAPLTPNLRAFYLDLLREIPDERLPSILGEVPATPSPPERDRPERAEPAHEVAVSPEIFDRPGDLLNVLLHEAIHGIHHERGITDTRPSGYHLVVFRETARTLGLECGFTGRHGWTSTRWPETGVPERYQRVLEDLKILEQQGAVHQRGVVAIDEPTPQSGRYRLVCDCPSESKKQRAVFVSRKVLREGGIVCALCQSPFRVAEGSETGASSSSPEHPNQKEKSRLELGVGRVPHAHQAKLS